MSSIERRDLYDNERNLTGETILKGEEIPEGKHILVVLVFIQNSEGKFLIQKRSEIKNGKYATTGGHPKSGENSLEGILTETKEEIGLELEPNDLKLYYSGESNKAFWDNYYIKMDIEDISKLKLQKEEVDSIEWMTVDEINELMRKGQFFKNHYEEFETLLKWLEREKSEEKN